MPYIKPPLFVRRVFNPIAIRFGIGGAQALLVPGRRSGTPRRTAIIPVDHHGARYLVSPRGETEWVRNLRAAQGLGELQSQSGSRSFTAVELPVAERPAVIAAYRAVAGRAVASFFVRLPDPADHPVFRLDPRAE
jgi:deazaflavin-dependent oxidoreductase (nitroreductase family)